MGKTEAEKLAYNAYARECRKRRLQDPQKRAEWNEYIRLYNQRAMTDPSKREKRNERQRKYNKTPAGKRHMRNQQLKGLYGITIKDYESKLIAQKHKCACCDTHINDLTCKRKTLCVDHNHSTGAIRDLICDRCNLILGKVNDNSQYLGLLKSYLERHA
jgi:hypothetical protein